jgi:hypothetical protein
VDLFNKDRVGELERELAEARAQIERLGLLETVQLQEYKTALDANIAETRSYYDNLVAAKAQELESATKTLETLNAQVVVTEDVAILQEVGVYEYQHPLDDAAAYQEQLEQIKANIKAMNRKDGGAVTGATTWTVNGSPAEGARMVRDFSKLMLRAFNAEADNLVRGLKPYKVDASVDRLRKVAATIEKLGKTMSIQISHTYLTLRENELRWTGDFRAKQAEEKEREKEERARLREEKKVEQELAKEKEKLEKERQHYINTLAKLEESGDLEAAARIRADLEIVDQKVADVDYRAANHRAGYVYIISNIGSFGEDLIKVGLTRRLEPRDRIRELSDASVPFNFDTHAIHFSDDAVTVESEMHRRLSDRRVNQINLRREFFRATPSEAKTLLSELAGEILEFEEIPEAAEFRQSQAILDRTAATSEPDVEVR